MIEHERRRRRPAVSCSLCRRRKIRCNRESPCSNCIRSRNEACIYETHTSLSPQKSIGHEQNTELGLASDPRECRESHYSAPIDGTSKTSTASTIPSYSSSPLVTSLANASSLPSQASAQDVESLKSRIRQLEMQLSRVTPKSTRSPAPASIATIETTSTEIGGTFHIHHESRLFGECHTVTRCVTHKTRLFGQSHWVNGVALFRDIIETIDPHVREETSKVVSGIQRCKSLARVIKFQRAPPWPSPPTADLPRKDVSDELVDGYLRTIETVYRILHVPSFQRDYEALWVSETKPDSAFLVQLKLVLAIGANVYDEKFSLRSSAIRWVYEAQTWLSEPQFKSRLGIQSLQTNLLLLLAREIVDVGGADFVWVSAGALLRTAMSMGLHRDPAHLPRRTKFAAEMRRRLWNTTLEIILQSSLTSGGPPFISLEDFDTEPPSNFDDDQLVADDAVSKAEDNFTQVSTAIALRKTFPARLAVAKFLNDLGSQGSYEETLRLDAELKASYRALCQTLQGYNSHTPSPSHFEKCATDFIMNRYLSCLHIPFLALGLHESAYAFSRKVAVETSLKLWCAAYPSSPIMASQSRRNHGSSDRHDLERLALCGSGFFRTSVFQATSVIAVELRTQLHEEESLGPIPLRLDLLSVLGDAKTWCLRSIEAGETNTKGYLLICLITAQIEGLVQGLEKDEFPKMLVKAAEEAEDMCLPILEDMVAQCQNKGTLDGLNQMSLSVPPEDWDFMMSDTLLNSGNAEPMNWMFNDETTYEPSLW
ncbi:uncharacterized protein BDR25DRAFT_251952 [Lindgomyces ingoldianus]|uniref:Uncharacterized protein n=1 Tax=Lindgomyces ingoldianus TaxID=673940 RepID=A0ACB6RDW4_9PLEO|nr:uncharacterized protein BDR25DRAFT_251952 [Lindgomyces ingoldianus]KAF2477302.1 hypothetical protein BDR25DRAFT_251952 [Lindgomyces ingoldianus]